MLDAAAYSAAADTNEVFYAFGESAAEVADLLLDQYIGRTLGGNGQATQLLLNVQYSAAGDDDGSPYEGTLLVVW